MLKSDFCTTFFLCQSFAILFLFLYTFPLRPFGEQISGFFFQFIGENIFFSDFPSILFVIFKRANKYCFSAWHDRAIMFLTISPPSFPQEIKWSAPYQFRKELYVILQRTARDLTVDNSLNFMDVTRQLCSKLDVCVE